MPLVTLAEVLGPAMRLGYAVPGLVCLGWEDARAYTMAAESVRAPVILQAGPGARAHMPLRVWAAMFRELGHASSVPVVAHLDHGHSPEECQAGLDAGFTSVMFDGSRLPLDDNIRKTAQVAAMAHAAGASCEGEIGFVGYAEGAPSLGTDPAEAALFAAETGIDAMAVSVGNVHLQQNTGAGLDLARIHAIKAICPVPLVIHGGSGVPKPERSALASASAISKFNIGTELRMAFGAALREAVNREPERFDRIAILAETHGPASAMAMEIFATLGAAGRA
jgi:fructose-bisphosphate aldolase class II